MDAEGEALLDLFEDGLITLDADWRIVSVNRAAERLLGASRQDAVGLVLGRDLPEPEAARMAVYRDVMDTREPRVMRGVRLEAPALAERLFDAEVVPVAGGGIAIVFREATERIRVQESEALREISRDILSRVDPEKVLRRVARHSRSLLAADFAAVAAVRGERQETEWLAVVGARSGLWDGTRFPPGQGTAGRVLDTGAPVVIVGFPENPDFPPEEFPLHVAEGTRSALGVPLIDSAQRTFGALIVGWRTPLAIGKREIELAQGLAQSAGIALDNARLFTDIASAREEAEGASAAKSRFLAVMSHELRTPLNAILGYVELLELGLTGPLSEAQRSYLDRVVVSSSHLLGLVNGILDIASLDTQHPPLEPEPVPVNELLESASLLVEPVAEERRIGIRRVFLCPPGVSLSGEKSMARQVLVNLLTNAVKFTEPGGEIGIVCSQHEGGEADPGWIEIAVEDTGIGIPRGQLETIFEPFVQAEEGYTRTRGGTGLGLAIARQLARRMGGDIEVRSEPGAGSRFTVRLPAAEAEPAEEELPRRAAAAVPGLAEVGRTLIRRAETIVDEMAQRLREHPEVPTAQRLDLPALRDHHASLIADIGASLCGVGDTPRDMAHLRDGTLIQRVIAERHGAQRARLGFAEEELEPEFRVLADAVERALTAETGGEHHRDARRVVADLLQRGLESSRRGHRVSKMIGLRTVG